VSPDVVTMSAGLLPTQHDDRTVMLSWPVGAVAEQLGVSTSTLRSWDRRYGLGPTRRTGGNHRRYGPGDVLRVRLMARLTAQGVPARTAADAIAEMDDRMIAARLVGRTTAPGASAPAPASAPGGSAVSIGTAARRAQVDVDDTQVVVDHIVAAARGLDALSLVHLYRSALRRFDLSDAWTGVFVPALRRIGDEWGTGRLGVESEHLASELLETELRAVVRAHRAVLSGSPVLLAGADDEQHHLPLLALEAELARMGTASVHLGARMPARATVAAIERLRPRAVFVWASLERTSSEPFWDLVGSTAGSTATTRRIVVGGPGWPDGLEDAVPGLVRVHDLASAVAALA